jgi:hypothetical protein
MVNRISHRGVTKLDETVLLFPGLVEALVELLLPGEAKFGFAGVCFWPLADCWIRLRGTHPSEACLCILRFRGRSTFTELEPD